MRENIIKLVLFNALQYGCLTYYGVFVASHVRDNLNGLSDYDRANHETMYGTPNTLNDVEIITPLTTVLTLLVVAASFWWCHGFLRRSIMHEVALFKPLLASAIAPLIGFFTFFIGGFARIPNFEYATFFCGLFSPFFLILISRPNQVPYDESKGND